MEAQIMRKYKFAAMILAAAMALTAAVGCSDKPGKSESSSRSQYKISDDGTLEGLADVEIMAELNQEADANQTGFTLNSVIDSGMRTDSGERYIYLDVTINNSTDKEYDLSVLNNFYVLFADGTETHYDVRTQLYATKNLDNYFVSPFTVPASGKFSGIVGGFLVGSEINEFTVCFFPTLDEARDKSNVVKVKVANDNIKKLTAVN